MDSIDLVSPIDAVVNSPLASVIDALTSGGGGVDGVLSDELPDVGSLLSMAAGPAEADPFITNLLAGAAIMFYFLVVVPVAVFLQTSWGTSPRCSVAEQGRWIPPTSTQQV